MLGAGPDTPEPHCLCCRSTNGPCCTAHLRATVLSASPEREREEGREGGKEMDEGRRREPCAGERSGGEAERE